MTAPWLFAVICAAGGVGAVLRYAIDAVVTPRVRFPYPVATTLINVTGSFALGVVAGAAVSGGVPPEVLLVVGGGLLGGFTTFSTASVEIARLLQKRRLLTAAVYAIGTVVIAVGAAALGLVIGSAL